MGLGFSLQLRAQSAWAPPFTSIGPAPNGPGLRIVKPQPTKGVGVYVLGSLYIGAFLVAWTKLLAATSATRFLCLVQKQHTDHQGVQSGTDGPSCTCHAKRTGEGFFWVVFKGQGFVQGPVGLHLIPPRWLGNDTSRIRRRLVEHPRFLVQLVRRLGAFHLELE